MATYAPASSLFAQMLAEERIHVRMDPAASTASFEMVGRVLTLPNLRVFTDDAMLLFIAHEVGHALYTPTSYGDRIRAVSAQYQFPRSAVDAAFNIIEDIRIERLIRAKYQGLGGFFARGYASLVHDRDFFKFGTVMTHPRWRRYAPMDRLNLYGKIGRMIGMTLTSPREVRWYNRAVTLETFAEVEALVVEILIDLRDHPERAPEPPPRVQRTRGERGASEDMTTVPMDDTTSEDDPTEGETSDDAAPEDATSAQDDASDGDPFRTETVDAERESLANARAQSRTQDAVLTLPVDVRGYAAGNIPVDALVRAWQASPAMRQSLHTLGETIKQDARQILASMVASFRANQSAWQQRRAHVSRSGVLDPTRLAQYRFTDDVFQRRTSIPDAQSHGIVVTLDWSSSMRSKLPTVILQTLHLIWFAEQLNIPIRVDAFADVVDPLSTEYAQRSPVPRVMGNLTCVGFYRSDADLTTKRDAVSMLLAILLHTANLASVVTAVKNGYQPNMVSAFEHDQQSLASMGARATAGLVPKMIRSHVLRCLATTPITEWVTFNQSTNTSYPWNMSGTALYGAIVGQTPVVRAFRDQHRVQQCISLWITDGKDTNGVSVIKGYDREGRPIVQSVKASFDVVDPFTAQRYPAVACGSVDSSCAQMFAYHRAATGATVLVMDITNQPLESFYRVLSRQDADAVVPQLGEISSTKKTMQQAIDASQRRASLNTKRGVLMPHVKGHFADEGIVVIQRAQFPTMGADAYIVTADAWWTDSGSYLSRVIEDASQTLTDREQRDRLTSAVKNMNHALAMRKLAQVLVPYLAAGR